MTGAALTDPGDYQLNYRLKAREGRGLAVTWQVSVGAWLCARLGPPQLLRSRSVQCRSVPLWESCRHPTTPALPRLAELGS